MTNQTGETIVRAAGDNCALPLPEWNATFRALSESATLHRLFAAQATRTPDAPAVLDDNRQLDYAELDRCANHLASKLRKLAVGRDVPVGIFMERRVEMVVAL